MTEVKQKMSNTEKQYILRCIYEPGGGYRNLLVENVLEDGRARNALLRKGITTLADLEKLLKGDKRIYKGGISERCEEAIFQSLVKLKDTPASKLLGDTMFFDMLHDYDALSMMWIGVFVKDKRPIGKLTRAGYKKIGDLRGIQEHLLESLIGANMLPRFHDLDTALKRPPEDNLSEIWRADLSSRRGRITLMQAKGNSRKDISQEEGVSQERIRQMTVKFFYGQMAYLELIDDRIKESGIEDLELKKIFSDADCRDIFLVWKKMNDHSRSRTITKEEWMEKNLPDYME